MGGTRRQVLRQVEKGFPFLPSGCQIVLDRQSQDLVLDNIRAQVARRWSQIVAELRSYGDQDLPTFLAESGLELSDILRQGRSSWTGLRRDAGLPTAPGSTLEQSLLRRVRAFAHVDDPVRARLYQQLLSGTAQSYDALSSTEQRAARMLFFSLWPDGGGYASYDDGFSALGAEEATRREISSVVDYAFDDTRQLTVALGVADEVPLRVHGRYQREEILAAIDYVNLQRRPTSVMQGVVYSEATNIDAFFMTLKKSEADYSPTTMYRDYPISPDLFHWESQSTTSIASPTGRRYINGTSTVLLFVRHEQRDDFGTSPYLFLGPATYVSHQGDRPIAITWRLATSMPAEFFHRAAAVAQ